MSGGIADVLHYLIFRFPRVPEDLLHRTFFEVLEQSPGALAEDIVRELHRDSHPPSQATPRFPAIDRALSALAVPGTVSFGTEFDAQAEQYRVLYSIKRSRSPRRPECDGIDLIEQTLKGLLEQERSAV